MIEISNHGPLITSTNYWGSEHELHGKALVSVNAGAIRILLPRTMRPVLNDWRKCEYAIVSRGPWTDEREENGIEILLEDHGDNPYAMHFGPQSFISGLPSEPPVGQEWVLTVWDQKKHKPHKAMERPCKWRAVEKIPCLKKWSA